MTASDKARKLAAKHPTWSLSRIGDACGLTKQGVANALRQTGKRGRPKGVAGKRKRPRKRANVGATNTTQNDDTQRTPADEKP
jgi:hypothetical protein